MNIVKTLGCLCCRDENKINILSSDGRDLYVYTEVRDIEELDIYGACHRRILGE